ncbi:MAG: saccharopine dehydrogenase C-terminal domain-containing protein [Chitinophagaceae bacterium]
MSKSILLFGAGKSATCLIDYLLQITADNNWQLVIADANREQILAKIGNAGGAKAVAINVESASERQALIKDADVVISLLPPSLHILVARDCVAIGKHLLTASYVDESMNELADAVKQKGLLFLCEMGLDPGIDHMSAMQLVHRIKAAGGTITSFKSHCGGLVAVESDDNPWHYKISWNPRNVVLAGKSGAIFRENGDVKQVDYEHLFEANKVVDMPGVGYLAYYPNRDSLSYIPVYNLEEVQTFVRTTLRYPEFCFGWKNIIELKLTDETKQYETDGMSLQQFFQQHFEKYNFSEWLEKQLTAKFEQTKELLEKLQQLLETEQEADEEERKELQDFMVIDEQGELTDINLDDVKTQAAATVAGQMHEANLAMKQVIFLGMDDTETIINKGLCSAADVLQFALEKKLVLQPQDKDMVVMMHEIDYTLENESKKISSCLVVNGQDAVRTAMAKTVGLPLGIAAKLLLQGKLQETGLHIPVISAIYEPVLQELQQHGIAFLEIED